MVHSAEHGACKGGAVHKPAPLVYRGLFSLYLCRQPFHLPKYLHSSIVEEVSLRMLRQSFPLVHEQGRHTILRKQDGEGEADRSRSNNEHGKRRWRMCSKITEGSSLCSSAAEEKAEGPHGVEVSMDETIVWIRRRITSSLAIT